RPGHLTAVRHAPTSNRDLAVDGGFHNEHAVWLDPVDRHERRAVMLAAHEDLAGFQSRRLLDDRHEAARRWAFHHVALDVIRIERAMDKIMVLPARRLAAVHPKMPSRLWLSNSA